MGDRQHRASLVGTQRTTTVPQVEYSWTSEVAVYNYRGGGRTSNVATSNVDSLALWRNMILRNRLYGGCVCFVCARKLTCVSMGGWVAYRGRHRVPCQIHTKHINTLFGQNVYVLNVKLVVHIVWPLGFRGVIDSWCLALCPHCARQFTVCRSPTVVTWPTERTASTRRNPLRFPR